MTQTFARESFKHIFFVCKSCLLPAVTCVFVFSGFRQQWSEQDDQQQPGCGVWPQPAVGTRQRHDAECYWANQQLHQSSAGPASSDFSLSSIPSPCCLCSSVKHGCTVDIWLSAASLRYSSSNSTHDDNVDRFIVCPVSLVLPYEFRLWLIWPEIVCLATIKSLHKYPFKNMHFNRPTFFF